METARRPWDGSFWTPPSLAWMIGLIVVVLKFHLALPAISALVIYCSSEELHKKILSKIKKPPTPFTFLLSFFIAMIGLIGILSIGGFLVLGMADSQAAATGLMLRVTETLKMIKLSLPHVFSSHIPVSSYLLLDQMEVWVLENGAAVAGASKKVLTASFHIIVGCFIGGLVFLNGARENSDRPKSLFILDMHNHISLFKKAFSRVFFAQFYISLFNTLFTGIFLAVVMPILGFDMPFLAALIFLTFVAGFIPILGNIVSNIVITVVALSISPVAAFTALAFLVIIHKLEYFLNAWIVGSKTKAKAFELLIAMLFFEAIFGIWGVIMAPVVYSYLKEELSGNP